MSSLAACRESYCTCLYDELSLLRCIEDSAGLRLTFPLWVVMTGIDHSGGKSLMFLAKLAAPQEVWELQTKYHAPFSPAKSGS